MQPRMDERPRRAGQALSNSARPRGLDRPDSRCPEGTGNVGHKDRNGLGVHGSRVQRSADEAPSLAQASAGASPPYASVARPSNIRRLGAPASARWDRGLYGGPATTNRPQHAPDYDWAWTPAHLRDWHHNSGTSSTGLQPSSWLAVS